MAKFKAWLAKNSKNGNYEEIAFVRDLKRLLAMPGITREYQAEPAMYGWMPALYLPGAQKDLLEDAAKGDPDRTRGSRPIAMPLTE